MDLTAASKLLDSLQPYGQGGLILVVILALYWIINKNAERQEKRLDLKDERHNKLVESIAIGCGEKVSAAFEKVADSHNKLSESSNRLVALAEAHQQDLTAVKTLVYKELGVDRRTDSN